MTKVADSFLRRVPLPCDSGQLVKAKQLFLILAAALGISYAARVYFEHAFPSSGSATNLVGKLNSPDTATVIQGFQRLTSRADPVGIPRALELLESPDESIWLNAAHYLGACKRSESVPWLIKALRHTSYRSDEATSAYLKGITGQDLGTDFVRWYNWWRVQPGQPPDFNWTSSLGDAPRIKTARKN